MDPECGNIFTSISLSAAHLRNCIKPSGQLQLPLSYSFFPPSSSTLSDAQPICRVRFQLATVNTEETDC